MKTCFKCGTEKPLSDFYRHREMADGHLNKCKACTKLDMRVDRETKPRVREYDRGRSMLPQRVALRRRVTAEWRTAHPDRAKAVTAAGNALRDGKLIRPALCEACGLPRPLQKHHHDYSRPLDVLWLCKPCHVMADKLRRALERLESEAS